MIIFHQIKWRNFLSTGNYWTDIELDANNHTLIVGANGSGKSTLLDALCFALFGKPFRNINKPNLLNSINKKDCCVELTFKTNNKSYKIIRGIKPNVFEIYENDVLINQEAAAKDYQEHFEKFVLKMNLKSFRQIVVLGSASFVPFMQLSAADRRLIIEDLLDIQIFSIMNTILKDRISNSKDLIVELKGKYDLSLQKYDLQKKHLEQLKQNNDDLIESYRAEIDSSLNTVNTLITKNQELLDIIDNHNDNITDKTSIDSKIKEITRLSSKIENNISKYLKDIEFFEHNDNCPTCKQSIASNVKDEELKSLRDKTNDSNDALKKIESKLLEEQNKLEKISEIQKQIQKLQIEIATNNTAISETNKYIQKVQKQIDSLKETEKNNEEVQSELDVLYNELKLYKTELKELLELKNYYDTASLLLKDSGIKTKIIKQYLPIINKLVNKYLASLDFFVNFNLDESFKEVIKSRHRDEFEYNNFSEGEKQRIDMALMLTWRAVAKLKNSVNTNLLILDEVFDSSLDTNGTEYLMNILQMLDGVNLFVISHKGDVLQDKFANVIKFEKVKNFSRKQK
jgi:DNA repair exonuclease SbcCD ATPase subunit